MKQLIGAFDVASISELNLITAIGCLQLKPVTRQETESTGYAFWVGIKKALQPVWDIVGFCGLLKSYVAANGRKFLYFRQTDFVARQTEYVIDSR